MEPYFKCTPHPTLCIVTLHFHLEYSTSNSGSLSPHRVFMGLVYIFLIRYILYIDILEVAILVWLFKSSMISLQEIVDIFVKWKLLYDMIMNYLKFEYLGGQCQILQQHQRCNSKLENCIIQTLDFLVRITYFAHLTQS